MRDNQNWTSDLIFSVLFHIIAFICLSGFVTWETKHPREEILEMALIDDLGSYGGKGSNADKGTGEAGAANSVLPSKQPKQEEVSTVQPTVTPQYTPPKFKRQEQPAPKPSIEPPIKPPIEPKASTSQAAASVAKAASTAAGSGSAAGNSTGTGSASGSGTSGAGDGSGSGSGTSGSGRGGGISPPAVLSSVKPPYPPGARQKGIEGVVGLRVLILENGRAGDASVISSSGDASLDAAALASINRWRFVPAKDLATGKAFATYTRVSISFELK